MSSRDPETGQFVSRSDSMSYADHDVHHVRHEVRWDGDTADSGPNDALTSEEQFEVTARGIDPDELAELRGMVVNVSIEPGLTVGSQDETGAVVAQYGSGYNLSDDEYLQGGGATITAVDTDDSGTDDFVVATKDTDEVGQLTHDTLSMYLGYSDTTDGTGGSSTGPSYRYFMDFGKAFGSGPYLDAADDFTSRLRLSARNTVADVRATAQYTLYYNVLEVEGGRTRFGR